jgi:hypothetical protein
MVNDYSMMPFVKYLFIDHENVLGEYATGGISEIECGRHCGIY